MAARKVMLLFDVDGTLTEPRKSATPEMLALLQRLRSKYLIGMVGGSDLKKQQEQLGDDVVRQFDCVFSENGLHSFKEGVEFHRQSLTKYLGDALLKQIVNTTLHAIADIDIPQKRGTFFELRNGMINVSPIGRNCSQEERDEFERFDKIHNIRKDLIAHLRTAYGDANQLVFSIGGQISFDVFPKGWDKTYCLQFIPDDVEVHFFGDKTMPGGNDYEIYSHPRCKGHAVQTFHDTIRILESEFPL
eukprot:PhF_6_TR31696/c0_g1_i1/m.46635/K17497/PMM; phosphomannomutase